VSSIASSLAESPGPAPRDLRAALDAAPMARARTAAVAVTVGLSALDGYDVLSLSFAAPAIVADWNVGKAALGLLLSIGLVGMAAGSLLLGPLADRIGRRRLVIINLLVMAAGMFASTFARSIFELGACRLVTGIGIGSMVAVINPLAAEFANNKRRPLAMALMTIGYPAGGLAGGLLAAMLIEVDGWRAVFLAGGIASLIMLPVVLVFLPESPHYLLARGGAREKRELGAMLERMGLGQIREFSFSPPAAQGGYSGVFARGQLGRTIQVTALNLLFVIPVYYVLSWLPQIVADAGFAPGQASLTGAMVNLAGIAGGLALGYAASAARLFPLTALVMAGTGIVVALIGIAPASLPLFMAGAIVCGFLLFAGMAGLYVVLATSFPAEARASGVGFVIGVGRAGSAAAPALAGWLFAAGLGTDSVSAVFGAFALAAASVLVSIIVSNRRRVAAP